LPSLRSDQLVITSAVSRSADGIWGLQI